MKPTKSLAFWALAFIYAVALLVVYTDVFTWRKDITINITTGSST